MTTAPTGPAPLADRLRTRTGVALVLALVCAATTLVYLPTLGHGFVWDDHSLIRDNRLLARPDALAVFGRGFWAGSGDVPEGPAADYYRPLTTLSFWFDLHLGDGRPWLFHLTNLLLACAGAALMALAAWELLRSGIWAGLAGLLFAAHSSHVESVAFVSGRTDLLLGLFIGLAAVALLRSIRKHNPAWWPLVVAGFGLALLSKETALLFPLLVALAPLLTQTRPGRSYWLLVLACVVVAGLYLALRASVLGAALPLPPDLPLLPRLLNAANTFGLYVKMFVWPFDHRAKLPLDPLFLNLTPNLLYAVIFLVSGPLLALRRRYRLLLWGYVWTILFLLPVVNLIPVGPQAAERLLYLPSAGLVFIIVTALSRFVAGQERLRQIAAIVLGAVIIFNGTDSLARSRVWRSDLALFSAMVREAPRAPSAYANLGRAVSPVDPDSSIRLYNRAILLDQGYVQAHVEVGIIYSRTGDLRRAVHHLRLAEQLRPDSPVVLNNLSLAWLAAGRIDSALAKAELALRYGPGLPEPLMSLGLALGLSGRTNEAGEKLRQALALKPELGSDLRGLALNPSLADPMLLNRLGSLLVAVADTALAETTYARALALDSACVPALYNRALLLLGRGDTAAARVLVRRAYRLRPDLAALRQLSERLR